MAWGTKTKFWLVVVGFVAKTLNIRLSTVDSTALCLNLSFFAQSLVLRSFHCIATSKKQ